MYFVYRFAYLCAEAVRKRYFSLFLISLFFSAMLFSGTRGAYVLVPAAMVLFVFLRFNRQVLVFCGIAGLFILVPDLRPDNQFKHRRFQTAFKPNEDISFQARAKNNQKRIQPYILVHPIGGEAWCHRGMGTAFYSAIVFGQLSTRQWLASAVLPWNSAG